MPRDVKRISESEEYFNILWLFFPYSYFLYSGLEISIGNSMSCSDIWHKYHE